MSLLSILGGVGEVAFDTARQGRQQLHAKELLETKNKMDSARANTKRQNMLLDLANTEKASRKDRFLALTQRGLNPDMARVVAQSKLTYDNMLLDMQHIDKLNEQDRMGRNYNDLFKIDFAAGKTPKLGDMPTYEPERAKDLSKPTIDLDSIKAQLDKAVTPEDIRKIDLGYTVTRVKQKEFEAIDSTKRIQLLGTRIDLAAQKINDLEASGTATPEAINAAKENYSSLKIERKRIYETSLRVAAETRADLGSKLFTYEQITGLNDDVDKERKGVFDALKADDIESLGLSLATLENLKFADGGKKFIETNKVNQQEKLKLYNYLTERAVRNVAMRMSSSADYTAPQIKEFTNQYSYSMQVNSEHHYRGEMFIPGMGEEIPTATFFQYLMKQQKDIKEGKQTSIYYDQGHNVKRHDTSSEEFDELIRRYKEFKLSRR